MKGGYKGVYDTEWEIYAPSKNTYMNWYRSSWKRSDSSVSGLLESFLGRWKKYVLSEHTPSHDNWMNTTITWIVHLISAIMSIPLTVMLILVSSISGYIFTIKGGYENAGLGSHSVKGGHESIKSKIYKILGALFMFWVGNSLIGAYQLLWVPWLLWAKGAFTNWRIVRDLFVHYKHLAAIVVFYAIISSAAIHLSGGVQMGAIGSVVVLALNWYYTIYSKSHTVNK